MAKGTDPICLLAFILISGALALPVPPVHAAPAAHGGSGDTRLHDAAWNSNPSVITALIEGSADPGARDEYGDTRLHDAARFNSNPSVITALIEGGADPGARDDAGKVPFDLLKENNAFEALRGTEACRLLNDGRFE